MSPSAIGLGSPNESFWLDALEPRGVAAPLRGAADADVVLVGAGYTSLTAALHLKRARPDLEVVVLEARHVGFGASGRNAGMVLAEPHLDRLRDMGPDRVRFTFEQTRDVVDAVEGLAREEGFDCGLERTGYLEMALYPAHLRRAAAMAAAARRVGIDDLAVLDRDQVRAAVRSERFVGGLSHTAGALLHPGRYLAGLKAAAQRLGVRLHETTPVLRARDGAEVEVETPEGRVRARHLVLGLNAYLPASGLSPVRDRAVTLFSFILLTEPLGEAHWSALGWEGRQGWSDMRRIHNYVRPVGRRLLFGGRVTYHFGLDSPAQLVAIYARLERELRATFPQLADVAIERRWAGPVAISVRRTPVIGSAGRHANVHYALGYSGIGVSLGTLSGRVLADVVLGEGARWDDLIYRRDRPWPLPPEPLRFLGFQGSYYAMRAADALDARG